MGVMIKNNELEEALKHFLTGSEKKEPPTFPLIYYYEGRHFRIVGSMKYIYSESENSYQAEITITDNKILEEYKNGKKWIDLSFLDLPQIRDFQEEEKKE